MIAPRYGTSRDVKYNFKLSAGDGEVNLDNIEYERMTQEVIHKIQAKGLGIIDKADFQEWGGGTFKWVRLTDKRDPVPREESIPPIKARGQKFENTGLQLQAYDDDCWVPDYVKQGTEVNVSDEIFKAIYKGYQRLTARAIVSASIQPRIKRKSEVTKNQTYPWISGGWAGTGTAVEREVVALPNDRVGGRVVRGSSGVGTLMNPDFNTFNDIRDKFWKSNVLDVELCGLMTPELDRVMQSMPQFYNRDHVTVETQDDYKSLSSKPIRWMGINWIRVEPEMVPLYVYNNKYLKGYTSAFDGLSPLVDSASGNIDLGGDPGANAAPKGWAPASPVAASSAANTRGKMENYTQPPVDPAFKTASSGAKYQVIPIWNPANMRYAVASMLAMNKMYRVPFYRNAPVISVAEWLGVTRIQDNLVFNLLIPRT